LGNVEPNQGVEIRYEQELDPVSFEFDLRDNEDHFDANRNVRIAGESSPDFTFLNELFDFSFTVTPSGSTFGSTISASAQWTGEFIGQNIEPLRSGLTATPPYFSVSTNGNLAFYTTNAPDHLRLARQNVDTGLPREPLFESKTDDPPPVEPVDTAGESVTVFNDAIVADSSSLRVRNITIGSLGSPAVIPAPEAVAGFLPYEPSPDAGTQPGPEIGPGTEMIAEAPSTEAIVVQASQSEAAANSSKTQVAALSHDQYFAVQESRHQAGWSAHSAAAQSRQHVQPASVSVPVSRQSFAGKQSWTTAGSTVAVPIEPRLRDLLLASKHSMDRGVGFGEALVSFNTTSEAPATTPEAFDALPIAPEVSDRFIATSSQPSVRELLMARYEPLPVLVGVSLLSAHLIADSRTANKKRSTRLKRPTRNLRGF
jgi:hypothetical protein